MTDKTTREEANETQKNAYIAYRNGEITREEYESIWFRAEKDAMLDAETDDQ